MIVALTLEIALVSTLVFHAGSEFIATRSIRQVKQTTQLSMATTSKTRSRDFRTREC